MFSDKISRLVHAGCRPNFLERCSPGSALYLQYRFKEKNKQDKSSRRRKVVDQKAKPTITVFETKKKDKPVINIPVTANKAIHEYKGETPVGDVYFIKDYPPLKHTFEQALTLHREYADPSMFNNMTGRVYVHFDLDMTTKKSSKTKPVLNDFILLPHPFPTEKLVRIVVICSDEEKTSALQHGAVHAGGAELISMLHPRKGSIPSSSYDLVICTHEMLQLVTDSKAVFRHLLPSEEKGTVTDDINGALKRLQDVIFLSTIKEGAKGIMQAPIGSLDMSDEHLRENMQALIGVLAARYKAHVIDGIKFLVPPSPEEFCVDPSLYVPDPDSYSKDSVKKGSKKTIQKKEEEEEDEVESKEGEMKSLKTEKDDLDKTADVEGKKEGEMESLKN